MDFIGDKGFVARTKGIICVYFTELEEKAGGKRWVLKCDHSRNMCTSLKGDELHFWQWAFGFSFSESE